MIVKFNCCTSVIVLSTEGWQKIYYFSQKNRLISCRFIMARIYLRKTNWVQDQIKDSGSYNTGDEVGESRQSFAKLQ